MARAAVLALVLAAAPAAAYRPLATEDTDTVDRGRVELQVSADVEHGDETLWARRVVIGIGLTDRFEARIEAGVGAVDAPAERGRAGMIDSVVGLKYRLLDESPTHPALLAAATVRLPTARSGLGEDGVDVTALAAGSKTIGAVAIMLNAGRTFVTSDPARDQWAASVAADYRVIEALSVVSEVVSSFGARDARDSVVVRGGAIVRVSPRLAVDAAVGFGVTRRSPEVEATVGLTVAW